MTGIALRSRSPASLPSPSPAGRGLAPAPTPTAAPSITTVLVAVSAPRVREALVALISAVEGYAVVAEAGTSEEALAAARRSRPALAIIDQDLPGCGGAWTIHQIAADRLAEAIVAIGLRADECTRFRAQASGARAFIQMGAATEELLATFQQALAAPASVGPAYLDLDLGGASRLALHPLPHGATRH